MTHNKTMPHSPKQYGRVEQDMRTIIEVARSMLRGKHLSLRLQGEVVQTAEFALNRCFHGGLGKNLLTEVAIQNQSTETEVQEDNQQRVHIDTSESVSVSSQHRNFMST